MSKDKQTLLHPMRVQVKAGSTADRVYCQKTGLPGNPLPMPKAIAKNIAPSPLRDLLFHGGKTVPNMQFQNLYVGDAKSWKESDIAQIDRAIATAMSDQRLENVIVQYFPGKRPSCTALASQVLAGSKPAMVSQGDVEKLLAKLFAEGTLGKRDLGTTCFNFILPSGTVLTDSAAITSSLAAAAGGRKRAAAVEQTASSLNGLGGYHGSIHLNSKTTLYYSVNAYSEVLPNGAENGIAVFDEPWKNVVATLYHELSEFRTDPDVEDAIRHSGDPQAIGFLGWTSRQGQEIGDYPITAAGSNLELVFQEVKAFKKRFFLPIQLQYSNFVHGPEGPLSKPHQ